MSPGHHDDERDDQTDQHVGEQQRHHRVRGRAHRFLESHQPCGERRAARDEQGQDEDAGQPEQAEDQSQRDLGTEPDLRRRVEHVADDAARRVGRRDVEGLPGQEGQRDEHQEPQHRDPARPSGQFASGGDGPVPQGAEESGGENERADKGDRERQCRDVRVRPGEFPRVPRQGDRSAGRHDDDGRDHAGQGTAGQFRGARRPQSEGGGDAHDQQPGENGQQGVAPAVRGPRPRTVPAVRSLCAHGPTLGSREMLRPSGGPPASACGPRG